MKKKYIYVLSISLVLCILWGTNKRMKNTLLLSATEIIANHQQDIWFHYPTIDSLFNGDRFRYFLFYKEKDFLINKDSTLLILNKDVYCSDTTISNIENKICLPSSAFPFIMKKEDKYMLCRIDSIERKDGKTKYKLHKIQ